MSDSSAPAWQPHLPDNQKITADDLVARGSLPAAWAARWREAPDDDALWHASSGWISNAELDRRTRTAAGRFRAAGLQPGDRVLFSAASSPDLVVAHVAALRAGLIVVPANTAYQRAEIAHIAADAQVAAAVVDVPERGEWVTDATDGTATITGVNMALPDGDPGQLDAASTSDAAMIGYTSGTTGRPKGAVLTHGNLLASSEGVRIAWRWTSADRLVLCLPLFHIHGLGVGLHGTLLAGGSAVLLPKFDVDGVLDAVAEHDTTMFFGVPTMYDRLAGSDRLPELSALRLCVAGSAPLPAALHRRITDASGQHVLERYGMTETVMNVSNPYEGERRPGSVGYPLPGVELTLDADTADGPGEIMLRGPNIFREYWNNADGTAAAFSDGWFRTGDIGALDPDGYVRIVGRAKELIISGGYNVYPREVEDAVRSHPAIDDVAVVGTPDDEWGEIVTAVVEASAPVTVDEIGAHVGARLAGYKRPRKLRVVDALPRNALGKVMKHELKDPT